SDLGTVTNTGTLNTGGYDVSAANLTGNESSSSVNVTGNSKKLTISEGDGTYSGTISVANGSLVDITAVTGENKQYTISTLTNAGTTNIKGGVVDLNGGANTGSILVTGGENDGSGTVTGTTVNLSSFANNGTASVNSGILNLLDTVTGSGAITIGNNKYDKTDETLTVATKEKIDAVLGIGYSTTIEELSLNNDAQLEVFTPSTTPTSVTVNKVNGTGFIAVKDADSTLTVGNSSTDTTLGNLTNAGTVNTVGNVASTSMSGANGYINVGTDSTQSKFTLSGGTSDDPNTLGTATIAKAESSLDVISGTSSATNMIGNGIVNVGRAASTDPAVEASHATLSITAADNGTGTGLAALNVNTSGSTANVNAADNKAYTIASLSNEGAVNTVGNIQASGISGTNGQINIGSTDKTSTFSVTGGNVITPNTLGVDTVASGSQLKITSGVSSATKITNNGTVLVGTNDSAATLRVGQLSGNGILFVDPAWSDIDADNTPANASNLAVGSWDANSDLLIGRNTIGILGSTDENKAVAAVTWLNANTPLAWGNPDKGTNYFGTALAVVDSQAVDSDSSLIVDSRLDAISDSLSDYKDKVTVASQSLLYVGSADNLTTPSNVVLSAGTINNSGTLLNQGFLQANAINNNG
ncbi:MAG: hypothetical protein J5492_02390, partial [Oxalobacter sp.]|nr:hypothetical protein [Oxalobacter sp.]